MQKDDELHRYRQEIRRLIAENQDLRRAATCFGDLAERLNRQLHAERRLRGADRFQTLRSRRDRQMVS
jgi:hypothetical protein